MQFRLGLILFQAETTTTPFQQISIYDPFIWREVVVFSVGVLHIFLSCQVLCLFDVKCDNYVAA